MATLAETGLSKNLGIVDVDRVYPDVSLLVAQCRDDVSQLRNTELAMFDSSDAEYVLGEPMTLDKPIGRTLPFKNPTFTLLDPIFSSPASIYPAIINPSDTVITQQNEATIQSRAELYEILGVESTEIRKNVRLYLGGAPVAEFMRSAVEVLDLNNQTLGHDKDGIPLLIGDDLLCIHLVQSAYQAGILLRSKLPFSHVERALEAFVVSTYAHHYWALSTLKGLGMSGRWHVAAQHFANAYGVKADEVADLAIINNDHILELVRKRKEKFPTFSSPSIQYDTLEETTTRRMARYLVEGH